MGHSKNPVKGNDKSVFYMRGNENTEGSIRFSIDSDMLCTNIEKKINNLWQPTSFETGPNSLWVGKNVGVASLGHHLASESSDGHLHFLVHSEYDGQLTTCDSQILYADYYAAYVPVQPDESSEFTGTVFNYSRLTTSHALLEKFYIKIGSTPATSPLRLEVWQGTNDTGTLIFDQYYPTNLFTANTEVGLDLQGKLEYSNNTNYFFRLSSPENFSLKTNAVGTEWTLAIAFSRVREDSLLQTKKYVDGDTYTSGQYLIDNRKIYICNVTGIQTGTFASNSAKWDLLSSVANDYWTKSGSTLTYNDGTRDRITATSSITRLISGNGNFEIKATGSEASMSYSQAYLRMTSESLIYRDGGADRIKILTAESVFKSPDSNQLITLNNNGIELTGNMTISGDIAKTGTLKITPTVNFEVWDSTRKRVNIQPTISQWWSPGGNMIIGLTDATINFHDGVRARIEITSTNSNLISPDGNKTLGVTNGIIDAQTDHFNIGDGVRTRFQTKTTNTSLFSPDGQAKIDLTNTKATTTVGTWFNEQTTTQYRLHDGTKARIFANNTQTDVVSPDGNSTCSVLNSEVTLTSRGYAGLDINITHSKLWSPDNNLSLAISNTETNISGQVTVCSGKLSKSFIIAPYSEHYSGGSMVLKGADKNDGDPGPLTYYSDYAIDNFWGYMRIFTGKTGAKYIRMQNVGAGASDKMHLNIDGGILAGVESGFKTPSAGIELRSTTEAMLPSRLTTTERDALTPENGMFFYNKTINKFQGYENNAWVNLIL